MNSEFYIARKFTFNRDRKKNVSSLMVNIAIIAVALSIAIMILSVAIVTGFKSEIIKKVIGFGSHITITNYSMNSSYETEPINKTQSFYPSLKTQPGFKHIQVYAIKAGIIKTKTDIQGVVLKGVDKNYDWSFFTDCMEEGNTLQLTDTGKSDKVLISRNLASLLKLKLNDNLFMYFVPSQKDKITLPLLRRYKISGIYNTGFEEFDKLYVFADIKDIQRLNQWDADQISGFEILIDDFSKIDEQTEYVDNISGYQFNPDGSKLMVMSIKDNYPQIFEWLNLTNTNVYVILIILVFVAGINMITGLLIIILERVGTIGLLKAMGATNYQIQKIFLYIAVLIIGKGVFWGNITGISLCLLQKYLGIIKLDPASYYVNVVPINLKIEHLLMLNAGSIIITSLMLIIPSFIVTKISPDQAIRFK